MAGVEKQQFLEMLLKEVRNAQPDDKEKLLSTLEQDLQRALLTLAIPAAAEEN